MQLLGPVRVPRRLTALDRHRVIALACGENHTLALMGDGESAGLRFARGLAPLLLAEEGLARPVKTHGILLRR